MVSHAHPARFLLLAAAVLSIPGGVAADEPAEWERDAVPGLFYVSPVGPDGVPTHAVFRIVDDLTGEPIPGATAQFVKGSDRPITGLVPAVMTGIADEEGWIRTRCYDLGWSPSWVGRLWVYVEAAGRGGLAFETGRVSPEVRLSPARDVVVDVRDALDRPVPRATIGVRSEATCGHNPDQRVAVSDREGRAVLRGLATRDGDEDAHSWEAYVAGEGLGATYHTIEIPRVPERVQILRHPPTTPVEGVVLDAEGKPVAGAHVGSRALHRGPWTATDSSGGFRLVGADPLDEIVVEHDFDDGGESSIRFTAPPAGIRRIVRLAPPGQIVASEPEVDVEMVLVDATTKEEIERERVPVVAVRDGDGETVVGASIQRIRLPSGSWTILVGGGVSRWALARAPVVVNAKEERPEPLTILVDRNPDVPVLLDGDPKKVSVSLVTATEEREVERWELEDGRVPVPSRVECVFRVQGAGRNTAWRLPVLFVPIPLDRRGPDAKPIRLRMPAPLVVHARLVRPDGKPATGSLSAPDEWWEPDSPASAEPTTEVYAEGSVRILVLPEDTGLMPQGITVAIPEGATDGARLDAGEIRLRPRGDPRLTVLGRDGKPPGDLRVRVLRDGILREIQSDDGVFDPRFPALAAGDVVVVDAYWDPLTRPARPVAKRLEGDGPWTIRNDLPPTAIVLDVADETGKPLEAVLVIDGKAYEGWDPGDDRVREPLAVAGLDPGPHRVAVSARGYLTRLYRVVLKEGERRVLKPRLTPVPAPKPTK